MVSVSQVLPDASARTAAVDVGRSFIVQAPAGSGKTYLLVNRYLALLSQVDAPEDILAMTFTRKAAAEMRERIIQALTEPEGDGDGERRRLIDAVLERDRAQGWALLHTPQRLRVQTIDSLCLQLVRQMPWTSGFGAVPTVSEDAHRLYAIAAERTIALVSDGSDEERAALAQLLYHYDNNQGRATAALADMLARRDQWVGEDLLDDASGFDREALQQRLTAAISYELAIVNAAMPADVNAALPALAAFAAGNVRDQHGVGEHPLQALEGIEAMPEGHADTLAEWRAIAHLLLTQSNASFRKAVDIKIGFPPAKDAAFAEPKAAMKALLKMLSEHPKAAYIAGALQRVRDLPVAAAYGDEQWAFLSQLGTVLRLALAQLHLVFQEHGCVDFSEVQFRARAALVKQENPTELALRLDYEIKHILVDEFQDTSEPQYALLTLLTRGWSPEGDRSLFLVGDPMQSIYRFRQANVSWFLRAVDEGIGEIPLTPLTLAANFRSQPDIVDWVNESFAAIFPSDEDAVSGAVTLNTSAAVRDSGDSESDGVNIHPCLTDQEEADTVAQLVAAHGDSHHDHDPPRQLAVLVRNRSHLPLVLRALRRHGIDYHGIDLDSLAQRSVVRDVLSLARALAHPADHVAWLAILRAPWCGLTLEELLPVTSHDSDRMSPVIVPTLLRQRINDAALSSGSRQRLAHLVAAMDRAVASRGRFRFADRLRWLWLTLGGPACCNQANDLDDAQAVFDLCDEYDAGDDIADFALLQQALNTLRATAKGDSTSPVQVMTIHQAKGLQFDSVIVAGLGRRPAPERAQMLLLGQTPSVNADGVVGTTKLVAPQPAKHFPDDGVYHFVKHIESHKSRLEEARLLYVACTRAERALHLVGAVTGKDNKPAKGSGLALLWPVVAYHFDDLESSSEPVADETVDGVTLRHLPDGYRVPPPRPSMSGRRLEMPRAEVDDVEYVWVGPTGRIVGTLVHQQLLEIAEQGLAAWDRDRIERSVPGWRRHLRRHGIGAHEVDAALQRMRQAVETMITSADGRWLLADHPYAANELALTSTTVVGVDSVAVDRTFVTDGVRWIVDYKTSYHDGADLKGFFAQEKLRYERQLTRYGHIMRQHDRARAIGGEEVVLALYFPLHDKLLSWPHQNR